MRLLYRDLFRHDRMGRRGVVAVWIAVMIPGLIMAASLGVEVSLWAVTKMELQRAADVSAIAGALNYGKTGNNQTAATFAARHAQLNGMTGMTAPTWTAGTSTLVNNEITAQIVTGAGNGLKNASDTALKVTVQKNFAPIISGLVNPGATYPIIATATAELITTTSNGSGGQPCLLALAGNTGVTTGTDITMSGSGTMNTPNCTIRSNSGFKTMGSGSISAQAIYVGGVYTHTGSATVTGPMYQNQGQIPDPYAGNSTLQTALTNANTATGTGQIDCSGAGPTCTGPSGSFSCVSGTGCTLQPGTYSGITITGSGNIIFSSGLYVFAGTVDLAGSGPVTGANVTILMAAGTAGAPKLFNFSGSGTFALTAATSAGATNNQIPGVAFASLTTGASSTVTGSGTNPFVGLIYLPNAQLTHTGSGYVGSPGCLMLIAKTIVTTGSGTFDASNCSTYGIPGFTSVGGVPSISAGLVR